MLDMDEAQSRACSYLDRLEEENPDISSFGCELAQSTGGGAVEIEVNVDADLSIFPHLSSTRTGTAVACPEVGISDTIQGCD